MNKRRSENKNFTNNTREQWSGILLLLFLLGSIVSLTLAFFVANDYATNYAQLSGKVMIEAVGKGTMYNSIEDSGTCNMVITLEDGYTVLIPGMQIDMHANVRVNRSTTKPLIRAKFSLKLYENVGANYVEIPAGRDQENLLGQMQYQLHQIVDDNGWYQYSDGFYYYIAGNDVESTPGNTLLAQVDATDTQQVVHFINEPVIFPESVTSEYSALRLVVKITFQAIQDFIPDDQGLKIDNTITNSQRIFFDFVSTELGDVTPMEYFTITTDGSGNKTISLKSGMTAPANLVLPSVDTDGKPITALDNSFQNNQNIKNVYVPSSYTSIAPNAFSGSSIQSIDMSSTSITTISENAFRNCTNLTSATLPEGLTTIGNSAFHYAGLTSIVLPSTVTTLGDSSLLLTNLQSIHIPANVTSIQRRAFSNSYIKTITVDDNNTHFKDDQGVALLSKDGKNFYYMVEEPVLPNQDYDIPDGVESVGQDAFYLCNYINKLYIPSSVKTFHEKAITISSRINLFEVDVNNSIFASSEDGLALLSKDGTEMFDYATNSLVTSYTIPDTVAVVKNHCFESIRYLQVLNIPASVQVIENNSLGTNHTSLRNVYVDADNAYFKDDDGRVLLSKNENILLHNCASNTSTSYIFPANVTTIAYGAFAGSKYLEEVVMQENVTNIEAFGFSGMTALKILKIFASNPPEIHYNNLSGFHSTCKIYVPSGSLSAYKTANVWKDYADIILPLP